MDGSNGIPAVELRGITKVFPGVVANDGIDLDLYRGEIHCLLGENGAGKSTLMQILAGMYRPDAGTVVHRRRSRGGRLSADGHRPRHRHGLPASDSGADLHRAREPAARQRGSGRRGDRLRLDDGERVPRSRNSPPNSARISMPRPRWGVCRSAGSSRWRSSRLSGGDRACSSSTSRPPCSRRARREDLGAVLVSLKAQGMAVVVITHKLREALASATASPCCDRGGWSAACRLRTARRPRASSTGRIVGMMFGDEAGELARSLRRRRASGPAGVARASAGRCRSRTAGRDGEARSAGARAARGVVRGAPRRDRSASPASTATGSESWPRSIAGQRRAERRVRLGGKDVDSARVWASAALGPGLRHRRPPGRGHRGLAAALAQPVLKRIGEQPFWRRPGAIARERRAPDGRGSDRRVRHPHARRETPAGTLSGGNIQKVLLARELSSDPQVVVYNKPTHGLDVKTTVADPRRKDPPTLAAGDGGRRRVLISTDLDELLETVRPGAASCRGGGWPGSSTTPAPGWSSASAS